MKILIQAKWDSRPRPVELSEILQPHPYDTHGELEHLKACTAANARAMGNLLAHLVNHNGLKIEAALEIVERGHLEVVT